MFQSPLPHLLIGIAHDVAFPCSMICSTRPTHIPFSLNRPTHVPLALNRPTTHELCACISCPNLSKIGKKLLSLFLSPLSHTILSSLIPPHASKNNTKHTLYTSKTQPSMPHFISAQADQLALQRFCPKEKHHTSS